MAFVGRIQEKARLQRFFANKTGMAALVYGRRRVGKSELIKQALKENDSKYLYYECKQTTESNNVESLTALVVELFHLPNVSFKDLESLLDYLFQASQKEPLVLVLDEYPYLRATVKGLDSILQALLDKYKEQCMLKLIVCGSYIDTMKSLLMEANPLYGRIDLTLYLKPMNYLESSLFYPEFSSADKVRLYSVFGGIPYYNRLIDPALSVEENIIELIASPGARLETEIALYLKSELAKIANANLVFETLAKGFYRYKDILEQSHISTGPTLIDVLERLIKMELIAKSAPINDENNKKKAGYYISDNLSLFYYKYIFRYASQLQIMQPEFFYKKYIEQDFATAYVPKIFEDIAKQYLVELNLRGLLKEPFCRIGRYYYDDPVHKTNGEFDVVTLDDKGYVFYEAKFRNKPLDRKLLEEEIAQVQATRLPCYAYGFFAKEGFTADVKEMPHVRLITLEEIYKL
ncbi:MAG: ATP-binding protein [Phascolarctobacterium sp.]|nr:ATP-binding protein [Phascolarctobacterium sp.]